MILGPGEPDQCHVADEWCSVSKVDRAVEVYAELLRRWCAGLRECPRSARWLGQAMSSSSTASDARRISILVGLLFGLAGMGSSSAAIALPVLARDLDVSTGVSAWAISLYALMLAVATAVYGRVSDLVGIRLPLLFGVGLMTTGALVGALAPTSGCSSPPGSSRAPARPPYPRSGVAIISARFRGKVRATALGRVAGVAAAVSCLGPLAGGSVEGLLGWRAVIALPMLGALLVPLLWRSLPTEGSGARLDLLGAVLVAGTAAGLVLLVQSPSTGPVVAAVGAALDRARCPGRRAVGAPSAARLPADVRDPQPRRRAQRARRGRRTRRLVRAADRRARRAGRRGLGALAGRRRPAAERRDGSARAPGRRPAAVPGRPRAVPGPRRGDRRGGARDRGARCLA